MRDELTRKRRTDAEHNRRHLVAVAHTAFARHGPDLPVRRIARLAGLAPATVHRHFPSRADLLAAVLAGQVDRCERQLRAALADPDSRRALTRTFHRFGQWRVREPGLVDVLSGPEFADRRRAHAEAFARLVDRARADRVLRPWVSVEDVRGALMAIPSARTSPAAKSLTRVLLTGLLALPAGEVPAAR
ncbi:TetR/AcrR family transcriptional regulator [Saccharothrix coeruleofusca]|uniref:TetR family transcriptional regulator n=1 Tax=Saccharothrix coeruleofusca TaxID=33919 RepID=A0A918AMK7_9PSEU|nr:TetR/AcrR family transcriptional regulator [Saccharothrix coeruleofusca]GGP49960.1 TetR family transcriptional regulator [Saccharothrix coeruleofusca]